MKRFLARLAGLIVLGMVLFQAGVANAQEPIKRWREIGNDNGVVIVEPSKHCQVSELIAAFDARFFAANQRHLTWQDIHAANPDRVFPVCFVNGRALFSSVGNTLPWDDCPERDQSIALGYGPAAQLRIPVKAEETYQQRQARHKAVDAYGAELGCTMANVDCFKQKIAASGSSQNPSQTSADAEAVKRLTAEVESLKKDLAAAEARAQANRPSVDPGELARLVAENESLKKQLEEARSAAVNKRPPKESQIIAELREANDGLVSAVKTLNDELEKLQGVKKDNDTLKLQNEKLTAAVGAQKLTIGSLQRGVETRDLILYTGGVAALIGLVVAFTLGRRKPGKKAFAKGQAAGRKEILEKVHPQAHPTLPSRPRPDAKGKRPQLSVERADTVLAPLPEAAKTDPMTIAAEAGFRLMEKDYLERSSKAAAKARQNGTSSVFKPPQPVPPAAPSAPEALAPPPAPTLSDPALAAAPSPDKPSEPRASDASELARLAERPSIQRLAESLSEGFKARTMPPGELLSDPEREQERAAMDKHLFRLEAEVKLYRQWLEGFFPAYASLFATHEAQSTAREKECHDAYTRGLNEGLGRPASPSPDNGATRSVIEPCPHCAEKDAKLDRIANAFCNLALSHEGPMELREWANQARSMEGFCESLTQVVTLPPREDGQRDALDTRVRIALVFTEHFMATAKNQLPQPQDSADRLNRPSTWDVSKESSPGVGVEDPPTTEVVMTPDGAPVIVEGEKGYGFAITTDGQRMVEGRRAHPDLMEAENLRRLEEDQHLSGVRPNPAHTVSGADNPPHSRRSRQFLLPVEPQEAAKALLARLKDVMRGMISTSPLIVDSPELDALEVILSAHGRPTDDLLRKVDDPALARSLVVPRPLQALLVEARTHGLRDRNSITLSPPALPAIRVSRTGSAE